MQAFNVMFAVSALVKQYPDHLNFSTHINLPFNVYDNELCDL